MSDLMDVAINETTTALEEAANNFLDKAQIWADFANEGYAQLKTLMAQKENITDEFRREERQRLEAAMRRRESHLVAMEFEGIENGEPIDEGNWSGYAGIQGRPSASMMRVSKNWRPCLAAVDK